MCNKDIGYIDKMFGLKENVSKRQERWVRDASDVILSRNLGTPQETTRKSSIISPVDSKIEWPINQFDNNMDEKIQNITEQLQKITATLHELQLSMTDKCSCEIYDKNTETKEFIPFINSESACGKDNITRISNNSLSMVVELLGLPENQEIVIYPFARKVNVPNLKDKEITLDFIDCKNFSGIVDCSVEKDAKGVYVMRPITFRISEEDEISFSKCTLPMKMFIYNKSI